MTALELFNQFPTAKVAYKAGNFDYFLEKAQAVDFAKHFNVGWSEVKREEVIAETTSGSEVSKVTKKDAEKAKAEKEAQEVADKAKAEKEAQEVADKANAEKEAQEVADKAKAAEK
jgi:hypothetical protein